MRRPFSRKRGTNASPYSRARTRVTRGRTRFDILTGVFGWPDVPGVGVTFGAERIDDVLEAKGLFPKEVQAGPRIILAAFDDPSHQYAFRCVSLLRNACIAAGICPVPGKVKGNSNRLPISDVR